MDCGDVGSRTGFFVLHAHEKACNPPGKPARCLTHSRHVWSWCLMLGDCSVAYAGAKEEIFVDIVEKLTAIFDAGGHQKSGSIVGAIQVCRTGG